VVHELLLVSAREQFAARGYAGASTSKIAAAAGVAEGLIFRHFENKAALFRSAVAEPFRELTDELVDLWEKDFVADSMSTEDLTAAWLHSLHHLMRDHRELVAALISADSSEGGSHPLAEAFARPLDFLEGVARQEKMGLGRSRSPAVTVRAIFGMVMSIAVLDGWLFAGVTCPPADATIAREMVELLLHGLTGPPPAGW
jgi:AcrR family transcriptional regulator